MRLSPALTVCVLGMQLCSPRTSNREAVRGFWFDRKKSNARLCPKPPGHRGGAEEGAKGIAEEAASPGKEEIGMALAFSLLQIVIRALPARKYLLCLLGWLARYGVYSTKGVSFALCHGCKSRCRRDIEVTG